MVTCARRLAPLLLGVALCADALAEVKLVGKTTIPGNARDGSGAKGTLEGGVPHQQLGGFSALAYTGQGNRFVVLADRGPADGATQFHCRFHRMDLVLNKEGELQAELVSTTLLHCSNGEPFVGSLEALGLSKKGAVLRLDPEGVAVGPKGTLFISDEYGPAIHEFDLRGRRLRSFPVPKHFLVAQPDADPGKEKSLNRTGRLPNRGMEGLALAPDGKTLYALMQGPLMQDGGGQGLHVRLLELDINSGKSREFVYVMESPECGLNEILALGEDEFLVIERDSKVGSKDRIARIYRINLKDASDIAAIDELPPRDLPKGIAPIRKTLLLDFLDPQFGLDPALLPEKFEGLALGPNLADGRHLLIVATDNDFQAEQASLFLAFAIDPVDLAPGPPGTKP